MKRERRSDGPEVPFNAGEHAGRTALERLKWRSRRGLLELDLVFTRFWAHEGEGMTEVEARALEGLLQLPDNDLLDLVMGKAQPPAGEAGDLVKKLKAA